MPLELYISNATERVTVEAVLKGGLSRRRKSRSTTPPGGSPASPAAGRSANVPSAHNHKYTKPSKTHHRDRVRVIRARARIRVLREREHRRLHSTHQPRLTRALTKGRTQSNAFDSRAHTSGHSSGVTVAASGARASSAPMSDSSVGADRLLFTGSVVEVHESHEDASDLNDPVCARGYKRG